MTITVSRNPGSTLEQDLAKALSVLSTTRLRLQSVTPNTKSIQIFLNDRILVLTPDPVCWTGDAFKITLPI